MEQTRRMKAYLSLLIVCILFSPLTMNARYFLKTIPVDPPTIEALISAHKQIKKEEDAMLVQLNLTKEEFSKSKKFTDKWKQTTDVLHKRLDDANSYIVLAMDIVKIANSLKQLIEEYADFTTLTYRYAAKKPYTLLFWSKANLQIKREVTKTTKLITEFVGNEAISAAGINILKATMKEKYQLIGLIQQNIFNIRSCIRHNDLVCRSALIFGFKPYHLDDFVGRDTEELITAKLIAQWYKDQDVKF